MNYAKSIRVQIIQPLIPEYRVPLFRRLAEHENLRVKICSSRTLPYRDYPSTVDTGEEYLNLEHSCVGLMGNRFLWQRKMELDHEMGKGDVLVVCGDLRYLSNIPLIWNAKRRKVGVVWWGHGFSKKPNRFLEAIRRIFMKLADVILLYTDEEVEEYKRLGLPMEKLFATNNALDQEPIKEATAAWGKERLKEFQEFENITEKHMLLFCGRRTNSVSLEDVFTALAQLRRTNDRYLFVIIGPDDSDGILGEKAKRLGVDDCIRWLGPIYDQHSLAPWFLSASCFVFPGAIGLSLIHAFSYGLPVIVPDCIHNPEIAAFCDGENGFFYKDDDVADLARKISAVVDHTEYQKQMSAEALRTVERDYNMDNMVRRYVAAIKAAAHKHRNDCI